jgi:hypothetical protein
LPKSAKKNFEMRNITFSFYLIIQRCLFEATLWAR